ncbi:hypothetical protein KKC63_02195 [Patescibacteria group bacterium]|nr:hypothetical protein [Patescibacteria group bacterium]MBU4023151.1 hypothetical protein [Patescibacteria group bacterium]
MKALNLPEKELRYLYKEKDMTTYEIADFYNCCQGAVWQYLKKHNIERLPQGRKSVIIDAFELKDLYINKKMSSRKIAKLYNCSYTAIDGKIKRLGLPTRSLAEAHIIYPRKDFEGDHAEKAYIIGFAMGDLRVRKSYINSETIHADCASTKREQIKLIKELFQGYGRIWIKKQPNRDNYIQIECYFNLSFDFLLKKRVLADKWISEDKELFCAFLAGFTDAEGSIFIDKKGLAFYSLGNYNHRLLRQIRSKLMSLGVVCSKMTEAKTKGKNFGTGFIHNENYWQLRVNRKIDLLKLFDLIGHRLRHEKRIRDMHRAIDNIDFRNKKYGYINM